MFLHEALAEALFCPSTAVPGERFAASYLRALETPPNAKHARLEMEFDVRSNVVEV